MGKNQNIFEGCWTFFTLVTPWEWGERSGVLGEWYPEKWTTWCRNTRCWRPFNQNIAWIKESSSEWRRAMRPFWGVTIATISVCFLNSRHNARCIIWYLIYVYPLWCGHQDSQILNGFPLRKSIRKSVWSSHYYSVEYRREKAIVIDHLLFGEIKNWVGRYNYFHLGQGEIDTQGR